MPYYVFSVRPFAQYAKRAEFDSFREASAQAKRLRAALVPGSGEQIKVMFAETEEQAVDLLCQPRSAGPSGDD
jgi:hypothetical protein